MTTPDAIHALVKKFELHQRLPSAHTSQEKKLLNRQIEAQINRLAGVRVVWANGR